MLPVAPKSWNFIKKWSQLLRAGNPDRKSRLECFNSKCNAPKSNFKSELIATTEFKDINADFNLITV